MCVCIRICRCKYKSTHICTDLTTNKTHFIFTCTYIIIMAELPYLYKCIANTMNTKYCHINITLLLRDM